MSERPRGNTTASGGKAILLLSKEASRLETAVGPDDARGLASP